jgi:hypothetical protein
VKRWIVLITILVAMIIGGAVAGGAIRFGEGTPTKRPTGVSLTVTRDFGQREIDTASASSVPAGETVMRFLQRHFDVTTRYGGGFVQSIEGLSGSMSGGSRVDWFYYVNGIESSEGAAARKIAPGDQIWWDRHDWRVAQRVPAVVGSFPEPFVSGENGRAIPLALVCAGEQRACKEVRTRLEDAGVTKLSSVTLGTGVGGQLLRIVVGPWSKIQHDPAVSLLAKGPGASGVYARPVAGGIELLDQAGRVVRTLRHGGLIAATRFQEQQPTWVITGSDDAGVQAAAASLRQDVLQQSFAVAIDEGRGVPLPVSAVP